MADRPKFNHWLAVEAGKALPYSHLAHKIAKALHPSDDEEIHYAAARINLEAELKQAVKAGILKVRNFAGMHVLVNPVGDELQRAVLLPEFDLELKSFLENRGIGLRINPHGSGPEYWTLENAATALQNQEGWHNGTRQSFQDQMKEAAESGSLIILDPQTCLPVRPQTVRTFCDLVTPANLNAWLEKKDAPYRWHVAKPEEIQIQAASTETPEQRRARWLEWYGSGERGAVQRVFEREKLLNPKADRSFIGKEIKKAKDERDGRERSGSMVRQLIRGGERGG